MNEGPDYRQHLAQAMVALGEDNEAQALVELTQAEAQAARVDPEGPRVAEVLNYVAQWAVQAGRPADARDALQRVVAIWQRFPELSAGLEDYYLQLTALCEQLGDAPAAQAWKEKARQAHAIREAKPWR